MYLNNLTSLFTKVCVVGLAIGFIGCGKNENLSKTTQANFSSAALTAADEAEGQAIFKAKCQTCHKPAFIVKKWTSAQTLNSMKTGAMPIGKTMAPNDAEKIMAYLKTFDRNW